MYKLIVQVSGANLAPSINQSFINLGITADEHYNWRLHFNKVYGALFKNYYFDHSIDRIREIWIFDSKQALEEFYSHMMDSDLSKNANRPYTIDSLVSSFNKSQLSLVDTVVHPDGSEVVIKDHQN